MLYFFSFCCQIGKNSNNQLLTCLYFLLKSLDHYVKDYEFILYTNFDIPINNPKLIIRPYYDNTVDKLYDKTKYGANWLNLSFNKINIYKDLHDEKGIDYIWIDLDTIITNNLSYLHNLDNLFVIHGGNCLYKSHCVVKDTLYIPENQYIQGAVWKINIKIYNDIMKLSEELKQKNLKPEYDLQSLFAYYFNITLNNDLDSNGINVLGLNYLPNNLSGLGIWDNNIYTSKHTNIEGIKNLYYESDILKTKYYPDKEIHFVMFTFNSLFESNIINSQEFRNIFYFLFNSEINFK